MNFSHYTTEQLTVYHRLCKDKRRGVRPFFGSVKDTIRLREALLVRQFSEETNRFKRTLLAAELLIEGLDPDLEESLLDD